MKPLGSAVAAAIGVLLASGPSIGQDACSSRGQLDTQYCDRDGDLVADPPTDPTKWKDPSTLVWAYTPVEDPAVYANVFKPFTDHLKQCTGRSIVYYPVQSNSAEISQASRPGRPALPSISPALCVCDQRKEG